MALPEESRSIVEQWKKKSYEISSTSNDSIVSLLSRSIDTMAVVLNKKADLDRVQRALSILEYERSLSLQFDKIRNDEVRSLVYGQIESLHFTISELIKERNQVKECEEMFTQTEEIPSWFDSPFDESLIKADNEDYWGDEIAINGEDVPYANDDNMDTQKVEVDIAGYRGEATSVVYNNDQVQSEVSELNIMRDESVFENGETINEDNEPMGGDREKDAFETAEVEQERRSSVKVTKLSKFADCDSLEYYDEDNTPVMKKPKTENWKMMIQKSLNAIKKDELSRKPSEEKRKIIKELKCTECEYRTFSISAFVMHLKNRHSTNLKMAGITFRCDCGAEVRSNVHGNKCPINNYTVVRYRDGPIQTFADIKATPKCLLCDKYPTTAYAYTRHLETHHNSFLSAQGIWLHCKCGVIYRSKTPLSNHTKECTHREFTLHKVADK